MNLNVQVTDNELRFDGFYRGEVVNNQDPLKSGRVQVLVYPMFADLPKAQHHLLPWATPAFGLMFGASKTSGTFTVPEAGSKVWVFFENGDYQTPVYFAEAYTPPDTKPVLTEHYGKRRGFKSTTGIVCYVDDDEKAVRIELGNGNLIYLTAQDDYILLKHHNGSQIKLRNDGAIYINATTTVNINGTSININGVGNLNAFLTGNATLTCTGNIKLEGASIDLN